MSKANRGKGTFERYNRGKGTCPVCGRTNIKATYEVEVGEKKFSVCKQCKAPFNRSGLRRRSAVKAGRFLLKSFTGYILIIY